MDSMIESLSPVAVAAGALPAMPPILVEKVAVSSVAMAWNPILPTKTFKKEPAVPKVPVEPPTNAAATTTPMKVVPLDKAVVAGSMPLPVVEAAGAGMVVVPVVSVEAAGDQAISAGQEASIPVQAQVYRPEMDKLSSRTHHKGNHEKAP